MKFFSSQQRESFGEIKANLPSKYGKRAGSRAVCFCGSANQNFIQKIKVLVHRNTFVQLRGSFKKKKMMSGRASLKLRQSIVINAKRPLPEDRSLFLNTQQVYILALTSTSFDTPLIIMVINLSHVPVP